MSENDSGTAVEAKRTKFEYRQLVRITVPIAYEGNMVRGMFGWVVGPSPGRDGHWGVEVVAGNRHHYVLHESQMEAAPVPVDYPASKHPPSALRVIINQGGVKRVIEGPFQICLGHESLAVLLKCLNAAAESPEWRYGWIKVFEEPEFKIDDNVPPLTWAEDR